MFPSINPTTTKAWASLLQNYTENKEVTISSLFAADADRFNKYSINIKHILFDYSKNNISAETLQLLLELATEG